MAPLLRGERSLGQDRLSPEIPHQRVSPRHRPGRRRHGRPERPAFLLARARGRAAAGLSRPRFDATRGLSRGIARDAQFATSGHQVLAHSRLTLWSKQQSAPGADLAPNAAAIIDSATKPALLLSPSRSGHEARDPTSASRGKESPTRACAARLQGDHAITGARDAGRAQCHGRERQRRPTLTIASTIHATDAGHSPPTASSR